MNRNYFLYKHIRTDTNEVFYIGIGTSPIKYKNNSEKYKRAYVKTKRNNYWNKIVNSTNYIVEIVIESTDLEFIKNKEIELIKLYGRKDLKKGTLCNFTDGGDGIKNVSNNTRYLMSLSKKGKISNRKGVKLNDETKRKISIKNKGRKLSDITKRKMSESRKGLKINISEDNRNKLILRNKSRAKNINPYLNFILNRNILKIREKEIILDKFPRGGCFGATPWNKGKTLSDDIKNKMSISAKNRKIKNV